ncbi:hypothetical protein ALC56_01914, partial [Trachymyrmex septentrionalis]
NQIRASREGFLPEEEESRKREAVGVNVTEATKWQMDGLGTELTALYAFLKREKEQEMCFLPGNDRSVILFDPANLESGATTHRINAIA